MAGFDTGATLADRFRTHAGDRTHLYGFALRGMADDWDTGGPVRAICRGYEDAPTGSALQLRLLAGLFRIVLTGRADELRPYYPCLGGSAPAADAWPVLRATMGRHVAELHEALAVPPQTNEVGRSAALLAGLFDLVHRSGTADIVLLEVGASAGLNLLLDRFRFTGDGWGYGPPDSPVLLADAIGGAVQPAPFRVVDRGGCDLDPVDPTTDAGRLLLTSFVWPFDLERHARLAAALEVAGRGPAPVDAAAASAWLGGQLDAVPAGPLPVVWHSITQLYWSAAERAAFEAVLAEASTRRPLAQVGMEYAGRRPDEQPEVRTRWWPGDGRPAQPRLIGTAGDHGVPVRLR